MVVSHWYIKNAPTYTEKDYRRKHFMLRVKVHGVLLSRGSFLASSRECQIRPHLGRDSGWVMTPFMRVDNYSTRNFATLEPSELGLPFTGPSDSLLSQQLLIFRHWAGVRLYTECFHVAKPCVFDKQFPSLILCPHLIMGLLLPKIRKQFAEFLCRGYVFAWAYSAMPPVSDFIRPTYMKQKQKTLKFG